MNIDYEKYRVITGIKSGIQYLICHVSSKKRKNLCKVWLKQTYENLSAQFA